MKKTLFTITLLSSFALQAAQLNTSTRPIKKSIGAVSTTIPNSLGGDPATWTPQQQNEQMTLQQQNIGENPATWTPLPDISKFKGASPFAAVSMQPNDMKVGDGFEVIPSNPSTGYRVDVSVSPSDAFRIVDVPATSGGAIGSTASMARRRYVANKPGTANVTVKTMTPGGTSGNVMQYVFDIK